MARLKDRYKAEVAPNLIKQFNYKNVMQAPKLDKIVINMGVGRAGQTNGDAKELDGAVRDMTAIAGQKPLVTRARKSVANFKLRQGSRVGCKVTLRGERMYEFFDRLVNATLPRIRDFQGISPNSFDGRGNFAMGMKEQLVFPEIDYDKIDKVRGMDIIICTTATTDEEARACSKRWGCRSAKNNRVSRKIGIAARPAVFSKGKRRAALLQDFVRIKRGLRDRANASKNVNNYQVCC